MWLLFHLAIFLICLLNPTSEKEIVKETKCQSPGSAVVYTKKNIMCIYGITFMNGFNEVLYFNDPNNNAEIANHLDKAGKDLCKIVSTLKVDDPYQQVIIPIGNKRIDLFITCCESCQFSSVEDWRIHLKSQFLLHRYAIVENFQERISYEMTKRKSGYNAPSICITEDYREISVTGNNFVCFTYGEQEFVNPLAGGNYPSKLKNLLRMGQYNATVAEYPLGSHCTMNYAHFSNSSELCKIGLFRTGFKYFCCCYGRYAHFCQRISALFFRKDNSTNHNLFCARHVLTIGNSRDEQEKSNMTLSMTISEINDTQIWDKHEYCYVRLWPNNTFQFDTNDDLCEEANVSDSRLLPIIRTFCSSAKDYHNFCPFKSSDANEANDIVCCCDHQHFCNYNPDIHAKLAGENKNRHKCFYNDRYQYLFNQYYMRTTRDDVCLLHYIDNYTASDMSMNDTENGLIFHSYPGNGFYPIDFSYIFLENNTCAYVEVKINQASIRNSVNCFKEHFSTNYMPVKIFVCSCTLEENGNHCDKKLESEIADRAKQFPIESLTKCAEFKLPEAEMNESDLIYVRHTSYCFTAASTISDKISGIRLRVKASAVTRLLAVRSGKHFDHIAFSMYNLTGTKEQFCTTFRKFNKIYAVCFCRSYDVNAPICNEYPKMIPTATRLLMREESGRTPRRFIRHLLNGDGKLWCQSSPFYATLFIDYKKSSLVRKTKCVSKHIELLKIERTHRAKVFDNSIFCDSLPSSAEKIGCFDLNLEEEESQSSQGSNVICCCNTEHECDQTSLQIRRIVSYLMKSIII